MSSSPSIIDNILVEGDSGISKNKPQAARAKYNPSDKKGVSQTMELAFILDDMMLKQMRTLEVQRDILNKFIKSTDPKAKKRVRKEGRDPNKPKRNKVAYILYCDDWRSANPTMPGNDSLKMGEAWRNLGDTDKLVYQQKAVKERERYEREYNEYKANLQTTGNADDSGSEGEDQDRAKDMGEGQGMGSSMGGIHDAAGISDISINVPSINQIIGGEGSSSKSPKNRKKGKHTDTNKGPGGIQGMTGMNINNV